jgi:hypothetical protein
MFHLVHHVEFYEMQYGLTLNQKSEQWILHVISESKSASYQSHVFWCMSEGQVN